MAHSLVEKLQGKPFVVTKQVIGKQVEYRVLTNQERVEIWRRYPMSDLVTTPEVIAAPTLARAIVSIDGVALNQFQEIQDLKRVSPSVDLFDLVAQHLREAYPFPVLIELYLGYLAVLDEFQKQLDDLKKNSINLTPEPSGKSVEPSEKIQ